MTVNAKFIFFIIPILIGFSHIYYKKYFKKKIIFYFLIFLSISSTLWYQFSYNETRKFMDLGNVNLANAINAETLDKKFKNLKWITLIYDDPSKEILSIKKTLEILKKDKSKKIIVTDYQFISVLLSSYDYSPSKFWHRGVSYPNINEKYFQIFKKLFINVIKKNDIKSLYSIKPLYLDDPKGDVLSIVLDKNCFKKTKLTDILDRYLMLECKELK